LPLAFAQSDFAVHTWTWSVAVQETALTENGQSFPQYVLSEAMVQ
jgi:hypothetical protein